jgi:hypothetical protein
MAGTIRQEVYQAGVSRVDITPPIGIRLCGYIVREGVSKAVGEPLTATALALRGEGTLVVLLALDLTLAPVNFVDQIREQCAQALPIPASHLLVNLSHTHSGPNLPGFATYDSSDQLAIQERYANDLIARCVQACLEAVARFQPVRLAAGWGDCPANINRRQKTSDNQVLLGEDPNGPCDSSVGVIRVDRLDGTPLAVAFRYSCHPVTLGPRTNIISPDFIGTARNLIEREFGCPSLFLQGCAGNLNPISGIGQDAENFEDTIRIGRMLGSEVIKTGSALRAHRRRAQPKLIESVAVYWLYEYENIPPGPEGKIRVEETRMELPLLPFEPIAQIENEATQWQLQKSEAESKRAAESVRNINQRFAFWAEKRLAAARRGPNPFPVQFPVQLIRLGDIAFLSLPFEPMAETGLAIRRSSPIPYTFVLGYSNGTVSYLPTPEVSLEGGMEAKLGYKNYLLPAELPGKWEMQIKQTAAQMLREP